MERSSASQAAPQPGPGASPSYPPTPPGLTGILRVDMGRVKPKLDEDGYGDAELEPLHDIGRGLPRERVDHVASQDHALASASGHELGLLPRAEGTCEGAKEETVADPIPGPWHWR